MKISISLDGGDVDFIDRYAAEHGVRSRSRVLRDALAALRARELGDEYAAAWSEWAEADEVAWEVVTADGVDRAGP